jgi:serine/threonine protein kinase
MIGQTISHYKILEKLGEGGMGVVYRARDTTLDRDVALKFLTTGLESGGPERARFLQEARAASALNHPNICDIHDIGETSDGRMFMVMACYEGETLKSRIANGPLQIEGAYDVVTQIARGLQKAHEKGIVHRDVKPGNVIITMDGTAKILDFGLAKLAGSKAGLTGAGATIGTVAYMSPEQARGGDVDHRTDIWSLGVVLYEMLSGLRPFRSEYDQAVVYGILNGEPDPLIGTRGGTGAAEGCRETFPEHGRVPVGTEPCGKEPWRRSPEVSSRAERDIAVDCRAPVCQYEPGS